MKINLPFFIGHCIVFIAVREQLSLCDEHQLQIFLKGAHGTAGRSLAAARLCGDIDGVEFWTVALYYLTVASKNLNQT